MKKTSNQIKIELMPGTVYEVKPGHKYLLIMPTASNIKELAPALKKFFGKQEVFVIAANDLTEVKLAELVEEVDQNG